mgnify:FL=1|tara:strand:- start:22 stop:213 length:192 start_codon:yes stop_codon:yes gene_type:complete
MRLDIEYRQLMSLKNILDKLYENYTEEIKQAYSDENTPIKEINRLNGERDELKPIIETFNRYR